jgi:hypothetical protein
LSGETSAPEPKKEEGLLGKISSAIGGKHEEPAKPQSLGDKINHALGGGSAGEHKEGGVTYAAFIIPSLILNGLPFIDALDKGMFDTSWWGVCNAYPSTTAIDFVQEHVLKQGPQNNESAVEQLKDKTIADSIKHQFKSATGKDFPGTTTKKWVVLRRYTFECTIIP